MKSFTLKPQDPRLLDITVCQPDRKSAWLGLCQDYLHEPGCVCVYMCLFMRFLLCGCVCLLFDKTRDYPSQEEHRRAKETSFSTVLSVLCTYHH